MVDSFFTQSYKGGVGSFRIIWVLGSAASESLTSYAGHGRIERLRKSSIGTASRRRHRSGPVVGDALPLGSRLTRQRDENRSDRARLVAASFFRVTPGRTLGGCFLSKLKERGEQSPLYFFNPAQSRFAYPAELFPTRLIGSRLPVPTLKRFATQLHYPLCRLLR